MLCYTHECHRLNGLESPFCIETGGRLAGPGEHVEARLTVPARSFARFDEGSSQWVWNPGIYRLHAGRSPRYLRVNTISADLTGFQGCPLNIFFLFAACGGEEKEKKEVFRGHPEPRQGAFPP